MLAEYLAGRFEEWLAEQTRRYEWSLRGALRRWLYDEATHWTAENYDLYLRTVIAIMVAWTEHPERFTYQLHDGREVAINSISEGGGTHDATWECIAADEYHRAAFMRRCERK